jgi:hypothetical protein
MVRLDRVVVDESHIVLETRFLRNLVFAATQLVYLTATLKPSEEIEFIRLMALPPKEYCHWFRSLTIRPNIAYSVHRGCAGDVRARGEGAVLMEGTSFGIV